MDSEMAEKLLTVLCEIRDAIRELVDAVNGVDPAVMLPPD
jgi:hypothetical protein